MASIMIFSNSSLSNATQFGRLLDCLVIVYGAITCIATIGFIINLIAMMISIRDKVKNASNSLDLHLVFCNQMAAVIVALYSSMALVNSSVGLSYQIMDRICKALYIGAPMFYISMIATMTLMSVEQYHAVIHPMKPRMSGKKVSVILLLVWSVDIAIAIPSIPEAKIDPLNTSICIFGNDQRRFIIIVALSYFTIVGYVIPVFIMLYCYTKIIAKLKLRTAIMENRIVVESYSQTRKKRIIKTLIIVSSIFTCTGIPFVIELIININAASNGFNLTGLEKDIEKVLASMATILLVLATTYNPAIFFVKKIKSCNFSCYNKVQEISDGTKDDKSSNTIARKRINNTFLT